MSIANELSSDIAAAVLAHKDEKSSADQNELIDVVKKVHMTLRRFAKEERRNKNYSNASPEPQSSRHMTADPLG